MQSLMQLTIWSKSCS